MPRSITAAEVYQNFDDLMQSPDTNLAHAKKVAQRWMAYSMPYLNVDSATGALTNKPFNDAMKAIYTSPLQCGEADLASWESDGPKFIPDWLFQGRFYELLQDGSKLKGGKFIIKH
ncbi:hypothetical protein G3O08_03290 [Cryomorpha ignava]|uniref:Uncharacterized protein n=1 Tax=Cryomorpha ignava TaxID=101383 RepID=A0A7K3WLK8_9FLAO|nr:hypothetical protein [Cryomorpha ignava]NEN22527.1 hypothetical protein [Cryomorpha ignava]